MALVYWCIFFRIFPCSRDRIEDNLALEYLLPIIPQGYFTSLSKYVSQIPMTDQRFGSGITVPDKMYKSAYRSLIVGKQKLEKLITTSDDPNSFSKLLGCETKAARAAGFPYDSNDSTKILTFKSFGGWTQIQAQILMILLIHLHSLRQLLLDFLLMMFLWLLFQLLCFFE